MKPTDNTNSPGQRKASFSTDYLQNLEEIETRLRWLSSWTVHHANNLRPKRDGLKVGGHQASCASMTAIMAALYFHALRPQDKVAVKPHAGPVLHAIHYLLGQQSQDNLERFRGLGGVQSYPSRTKDSIPVDFSTGSVGLGVAATAFSSLAQDYLLSHRHLAPERMGRMIALLGDAELDEGNIYECLIEGYKHNLRNCWWIVDYNRQSLDATTADRMFDRFDDIFETCGWRVITLKYGKAQLEAFGRPGGKALQDWIDKCPNADFSALTFQGGAAWRERLLADIGDRGSARDLIGSYSDDDLASLMTNLGGHCVASLAETFDAMDDERPTLLIAYTVKGYGLPLAGHKDNHSGMMNTGQIEQFRTRLGIAEGEEWDRWGGMGNNAAARLQAFVDGSVLASKSAEPKAPMVALPKRLDTPQESSQSTQSAFGKILHGLAKSDELLADRIVTTAPDVTQTTNLGAFVNQRGLFFRQQMEDVFKNAKIPSAQKWTGSGSGQHIELGIAENNFFLALASFGLTAPHFGTRLFPVGTVYDPFIARGLDALNYACYMDARFLLVGTPSGITLAAEGGAHQSINTPLIGMGQANLESFEPAFADEVALMMHAAFESMQDPEGSSWYLRLSTRNIDQVSDKPQGWEADALQGAYWLKPPAQGSRAAIAYTGAVAPEAIEAWEAMQEDFPGMGLLAITSTDRLHRGWMEQTSARWKGKAPQSCHLSNLLGSLGPQANIVTVLDGSPSALSWIGSLRGDRVSPLGTMDFGQTGDLPDLYAQYRLDAEAIIDAMAELLI
ncbi:MAG: transketolase [Pseudomonadota bacterium]